MHSRIKRIHSISAWVLIQALLLTPALPAVATENLRVEQKEAQSGLEELRQKLGGLEEIATVEEAMGKFFGKKSGRDDEIKLEQFLAERWTEQIRAAADALQSATNPGDRSSAESALQKAIARHEKQIDEFVQRVEEDHRKAGLLKKEQKIGPYRLPPLDPKEIPAAGQRSGSGDLAVDIPANRAYYELERLRLMAHAAIQRVLGREIVVNIGIGFVGTAVTTATAAESRKDFRKIPSGQKKKLTYRSPLEGTQEAYYTIAYQRPSPASAYKVPAVNRGVSPIATKDATVGQKIGETTQKGLLTATFLSGSVAVADIIMLETELHAAKVLPTHFEHAQIHDEATVELIRQVGQLMQADALVIVESTIGPGFLRNTLLPAMNDELRERGVLANGQNANLAHAFQRLEPGPRWYQSLLEQERVGAGVTEEANRKLEGYFRTVGFQHRILSRVESVEFMKTLENAWRFGLLELMSAYMRAGEVVGADTFEIARMIARARPTTHALIAALPSIQVGGYCVPKELMVMEASLGDNYGLSTADIMEIFNTRFHSALASDFRGRLTPARAIEALAEQGVRLDDARVHVMGISYAAGVADTRMSGVERAVRELAVLGVPASHISVTDPYAASWPEVQQQQLTNPEKWGYGLRNQTGLSSVVVQRTADPYETFTPEQDVIVFGTRHPQYVGKAKAEETQQKEPGLDPVRMAARMMGREGKVLIDTFDFFSDADYKQLLALGWKIRALGKGHIDDLEKLLTTADRIAATKTLLTELRALRGQAGVSSQELSLAITAVRARLRHLKSLLPSESAKKPATQTAREKTARENQVRDEAFHLEQAMFYAQARLAEARQWFDEDDARVARAQRDVRILQLRSQRGKQGEIAQLTGERQADVAEYSEVSVVRPALQKTAGIIKRSSFMHGVPARYLVTHRPVPASDEAQVDAAVSGPVTRSKLLLLANYLDQAFHMMDYMLLELLTPEEMAQMLTDIRHREEAAHPERTLHPETRPIPYRVYGDDGGVAQKTNVTVKMVHPVRWRTNLENGDMEVETDEASWTNRVLKQLPDVRRADIPDTWGRYFVLIKPRLAPVFSLVGPKSKRVREEKAELRAYPPGFDDLPPELALWLARDVVGQGMMLTTLSSEGAVEQDKVRLLMVVDPFGAGSGRAGYLVWADSLQPVVSVTPEGWEMPVSVKGVGLFVGGDERFPHASVETLGTTTGRRVSGGMSKSGTVGQSTLAQAPGFVTGVGSEHGLTALSVTDANYNGLSPRLVFGANFMFTHGVDGPSGEKTEYFLSARQEPDTARMGWSFRGKPFDSEREVQNAAAVLGWNSAELLAHLPQPAIHIALSLDNVQANGYLTDPDSIVPPLYRERNPYGALFKYFGFSMQQTVMGWEQMKASREGTAFNVEDRNLALMRPWLRSFLRHLLESGKVRREPFAKFDRLSRLSENEFPVAVRDLYGGSSNKNAFNALAINLIDTLWNHYLAYEIFRNRLQFGYSHTVESTYTGTADELFDPSSEENARQYLASQRQLLEISRRLIEEGRYPPVPFDFDRALEEVGRHEQRLIQMETEHATDFREVYPLGFYNSEVKPVVAVLDLSAVQAGDRAIHVAGEVPEAAPIVEKKVVTAGPKTPASPKSGLEETALFTLDQWAQIAEHPDSAGLRSVVGSYVPAPYVQKELDKAIALIQSAQSSGLFLLDQPVALVRTTGRARIFMGHPDLMGIGAFSIDAATHQSVWMLAQMTNDGKVIADNLQPEYGRLNEFGINDKDVLPENAGSIAQARPDWLAWAQSHTFENRWEGLLKGTLAVIRTKMMDPTGRRRDDLSGKGLRLLLSESDIPSGKGFSASSSIPAGIGLALNALWEGQNATSLILSPENLRQLDYAAYVVDDLAGVADITAILEGELGQATVLWYDPDRVGQKLVFPPGFRAFAFDSNIRRLNHTSYPPSVRNYGKNIQTLTNISVPLAILWIRMLALNHPKDFGFLNEVLTAHWPSGVMRELTEAPDAAIRDRKYAANVVPAGQKPAVGYGAEAKRREFVAQVMARVPNEWTLDNIVAALREGLPPTFYPQIDSLAQELVPLGAHEVDARTTAGQRQLQQMRNSTVIPMRQMALYGMRETDRGLKYIAAAQEGNTAVLLRMMQEAHDGDRALYDPNPPFLAGTPRLSSWGLSNPPEAFQRSLVEIDELVDRFEREVGPQIGAEGAMAARVSGAGLGGLIMAAVDEKRAPGAYEAAVKWLRSRRPAHEVIEIAPSAGARVIRLPETQVTAPIGTISSLQAELTARVIGYRPGKQTGKLAFVVTPDGVSKFAVAGVVFGAGNIAADVIAKDEEQQKLIEQHLATLGFDMTQVIVYSAEGEPWNGDVTQVMNDLAQSRTEAGYAVQTVTRDTGLGDIGQFLGIAAAESDVREMELIAVDSNDVWS